jgi:predicted ABC-type ATPase
MHPSPPEEVFDLLAALAAKEQPLLLILVGPNGAGKSTFYQRYLSTISLPFINADVLARTLVEAGAPEGEATERLAADLAEKRRQDLLSKRESFITETVFSDPVGSKVEGLRTAQATGYAVAMIFVC